MSITVPNTMYASLFKLYTPAGNVTQANARNICCFLTLATGVNKNLLCRAQEALASPRISNKAMREILVSMFEHVTIWAPLDPAVYTHGYKVRVCETILPDPETIVFELGGVYMNRDNKEGVSNKILEWYDKQRPIDLLLAIECRVDTPENVYTGLDNMGNNLF